MKTYEELLAERNTLVAFVEKIRQMSYEKSSDMLIRYGIDGANCKRIYALMQDMVPQQCLAEIKAEAGRAGYVEGADNYFDRHYDKDVSDSVLKAAEEYAAKIRNTGTWLRDENVNGGKRQGGEK